jgi:hypothetical protein
LVMMHTLRPAFIGFLLASTFAFAVRHWMFPWRCPNLCC